MIFCWKYGSKEKWHHIYFEVHNKNLFWCWHKNAFTKKFREMDMKKKWSYHNCIASSKLAYNQISLFDWHFGRWHLWYYFPSSLVNLASHSIFVNISTNHKDLIDFRKCHLDRVVSVTNSTMFPNFECVKMGSIIVKSLEILWGLLIKIFLFILP